MNKILNTSELQSNTHTVDTESFIDIPQPQKIKIDHSSIHGRGVFATGNIDVDELIERCPMVPLDHRAKYHKDSQLFRYLYTHGCSCSECNNHGRILLMVLGYGMIYNHQDIPNTIWKFNYKDNIADVVATQEIKKGEEIFVSYGNNYFNGRKKITLEKNKPSIHFNTNIDMPEEWQKWIKDSIDFGVSIENIKEVLISNRFDICLIEQILGE